MSDHIRDMYGKSEDDDLGKIVPAKDEKNDLRGLYSENEALRSLVRKHAETIASMKRQITNDGNQIRSLHRSITNLSNAQNKMQNELDHKIDTRD